MRPIILNTSISSFIKDFGEFSLAVATILSTVLIYLLKKLFNYLMFKSDIEALKEIVKDQNKKLETLSEKLQTLLDNQSNIKHDVELIKQDLENAKSNFTKRQIIFRTKKI